MLALILVDSQFGNTARIADAVAQGIGSDTSAIRMGHSGSPRDMLQELDVEGLDLLVVGGPTINRGMSPGLQAILDEIESRIRGLVVATFDTRVHGPGLITGSAAKRADKQLRSAGAELLLPPESFYVRREAPSPSGRPRPEDVLLVPDELERARSWGALLRDALAARKAA